LSKFLPFVIATALLAALPSSGFAAAHVANAATSKLCGPDAPESYKRPGGYCDQLDDLGSLAPKGEGSHCAKFADAGFRFDEIQGRLLMATPPMDPCCAGFIMQMQLPVAGILLAC